MTREAKIAIALFATLALAPGCHEEEAIPELLPIGAFALVDEDGEPFGTADLRGRVWIADFIFTGCPSICPVLSSQMANLHRRLEGSAVRFVSLSVDPERDTPERLREYATRFRADRARWTFLTGPPGDVRRAIAQSFHASVGDPEPLADGRYDVMHDARFLLVDRRGILRGLYEPNREGLDRLERHARALVEEP